MSSSLPVIAVAGLGIESSTFSPARTQIPAFHPRRGADVLTRYPFLDPGAPLREAADWRGALVGKAQPGGMVTAAAYAELSAELLDRLGELGPLDGLWYDIHGAMTVEEWTTRRWSCWRGSGRSSVRTCSCRPPWTCTATSRANWSTAAT